MEEVKWTDKVINKVVLRRGDEKITLLDAVIMRKANWLVHIMMNNILLLNTTERKVKG